MNEFDHNHHCRWRKRYFHAMREQKLAEFLLRWMSIAAALCFMGTQNLRVELRWDQGITLEIGQIVHDPVTN